MLKVSLIFFAILICAQTTRAQTIRVRIHNGVKAVRVTGQEMLANGESITAFSVERVDERGEDVWRLTEASGARGLARVATSELGERGPAALVSQTSTPLK